jgi:carbonic anhydrase/acetyltransferase-like protein (isoleucine patch superfamily)
MIREFNGKNPQIASSAFVSETAYITGDVEIGENANIWPGAVIRGDIAKITIGKNTSIEDNCVVHSATGIIIGENTIVGHGAVLHCKKIGKNVLIGNNATVLDNAEIGDYCVIAAGSVVAPDTKFLAESLAMGVPAKVTGKLSQEQKDYITMGSAFNIKLAQEYKKQGL